MFLATLPDQVVNLNHEGTATTKSFASSSHFRPDPILQCVDTKAALDLGLDVTLGPRQGPGTGHLLQI